jgi:hypothetical protein
VADFTVSGLSEGPVVVRDSAIVQSTDEATADRKLPAVTSRQHVGYPEFCFQCVRITERAVSLRLMRL